MSILKVEIREGYTTAELIECRNGERFASGAGMVDKINWDKMHEALDKLKEAIINGQE